MGVSKNNGTPKWMVKIMENPMKMDDSGVPLFLEIPTSSFRVHVPASELLVVSRSVVFHWIIAQIFGVQIRDLKKRPLKPPPTLR